MPKTILNKSEKAMYKEYQELMEEHGITPRLPYQWVTFHRQVQAQRKKINRAKSKAKA